MLRAIVFGIRVRWLQRQIRIADQQHVKIFKEAKAKPDYHLVFDRLNFDRFNDFEEFNEMIEELQSDYLVDWAQRARVPVPVRTATEDDNWIGSNRSGRMRLTKTSAAELRRALRQEGKESFESWSRWVTLAFQCLAGVISILSLTVAIIALKLKN